MAYSHGVGGLDVEWQQALHWVKKPLWHKLSTPLLWPLSHYFGAKKTPLDLESLDID
jgi:hypothetical protein